MRKRGTVWIIVALLLAACFSLSGCGTDDIDISDYEQMTITLTGLEEGEQAITIAELMLMCHKETHKRLIDSSLLFRKFCFRTFFFNADML